MSSIDDFRKLNSYLIKSGIPFHTYALEEKRKVKAVLKGVPVEIETEDIKADLLPDYASPAFSSSPDAEAAARSGVLAPTRMSYESEQIRLGSLLQEVLGEDGLSMSSGSEAGSDSESADPLPDELHNSESEEELSDRES
ncbi:hypothetical protein EVAR_10669_1 [Eumeta japonica]|uniref:Uncharacterized protein n=1 Tax=Eumeta variegata TaxID=151549 RepID=A0A4C1U761_EUMVA|nr:hypothetical protein EVAR_10669_1 [Eumeta japonica]